MKLGKKIRNAVIAAAIILTMLALVVLASFSMSENKVSELDININNTKVEAISTVVRPTTVTVAADGAIVCESIIQGARDCDLLDGTYTFRVVGKQANGTEETKDYQVELLNEYNDVTYTSNTSLGDTSTEYKMLVVKYHGNLTIESGVTLTSTKVNNLSYKKGMYICVLGTFTNKGEISMTARGTYNVSGENVYLWKNTDESFEYVPASGAAGLAAHITSGYTGVGKVGNSGTNRATGGGGQGGYITNGNNNSSSSYVGLSTGGTSYAGGNGSGGVVRCNDSPVGAGSSQASTTNGGNGTAWDRGSNTYYFAGGGAGQVGGSSGYCRLGTGNTDTAAPYGVGGLLVVYADNLTNYGTISSNGSNGAGAWCSLPGSYRGAVGGGGSGGGSVNVFYNTTNALGTITAQGGAGGNVQRCTNGNMGYYNGGAGGNGSVTLTKLLPDLNYTKKQVEVNVGSTYTVDKSQIQYVQQNEEQGTAIAVGSLTFEMLDTSIATVDNNGTIRAIKQGRTKLKILDTTNNLETYVIVEVVNGAKIDVQEGLHYTVALKQNGTVWTYGLNDKGQLGIDNNENKLSPTKVESLRNIKAIATGYSHSLALASDGKVYAWGLGTSGQLGNGGNENSNVPMQVDGLSNIVRIDAYKNISIALDSDGKVYVWGEGYATLPMRVVFSEKVAEISGTAMLTEKGQVYLITDTSAPISGLSRILQISCGTSHFLATDVNDIAYAMGTNTYGELKTATTGNIKLYEMAYDISNISAGTQISFLKGNNGKVYSLGNNANGQIGLNATAKATELTEPSISENIEMEIISAGEGTHSGLVDINGYVWHSGTNTNGELGVGNNTDSKVFIKTGESIVTTNQEDLVYLDIGESITLYDILENTYNLKIDLIDDDQSHFDITLSNNNAIRLDGRKITAVDYGKTTVTITHVETGRTKEIVISVIMKMDSIVQGFRDTNLPDGEYEILIQDEVYAVELINYYDDMHYSLEEGQTERVVSLGDNSEDYKTLVVKYHGNLTVDKGVTLTANTSNGLTYKKGMYICVLGDTVNAGKISMTARGTYNVEGQDVYLWKNIDSSYEYVPSEGGEGHVAVQSFLIGGQRYEGLDGKTGGPRSTGGGGQGSAIINGNDGSRYSWHGITTGGNSYSGGNGSGGFVRCNDPAVAASATEATATKGGNAHAWDRNPDSSYFAGGGAGTVGGTSSYNRMSGTSDTKGEDGTGGLLILYTDELTNTGEIVAEGSKGAGGTFRGTKRYNGVVGGGGSGGGSVNIFARLMNQASVISADGGLGGDVSSSSNVNMGRHNGGNGGNGSVTINLLGSVLNYNTKKIEIKVDENYVVDQSKLEYIKLNEIQTEDLTVGTLKFESMDTSIATVDNSGKITGVSVGRTKVKITDLVNEYSTYIIVVVTKDGLVTPELKEGEDFTIALKANGTVWSYGANDRGQLGINSQDDSNVAVQVIKEDEIELNNIVHIDANKNMAIALDSNGNVYVWGEISKLVEQEVEVQNGEEISTEIVRKLEIESMQTARLVDGLSNIIKVSIYDGNFYALDNSGKLYTFGKDYVGISELDTNVSIADMSADALLGEDGRVYLLSNLDKPIDYLYNICELDAGEGHYLFINLDGYVYSYGKNESGQLGDGRNISLNVPVLVRNENGYITDAISVSAGNKTSIAIGNDGKCYVWGDNSNYKLGIYEDKVNIATEIPVVQNRSGDNLELPKFEIAETGKNHSNIMDENGFVYSVGLNTRGQLGTEDDIDREVFTKLGTIGITTRPKEISIPVGTTKDIAIIPSNSFNLKTDISYNAEIEAESKNTKEVLVEEISGIDNNGVTNTNNYLENYKLTGNKIGRTLVVAKSEDGDLNIWVNVVDKEDAKVSAKVENGNRFSVALKSNGTVWTWGNNPNGQLGIGTTISYNEPVQVETQEEIIDISVGENHTLILGKSGKVYSFGYNSQGQLGTGNSTTYKAPVEIDLTNIAKVVAVGNTSYAIDKEGKVYAWGEGYNKLPESLQIEENVVDIGKNYYLTDDGIVRKISNNQELLLSLNEYNPSEPPVIEDEKIMQISEGNNFILMLSESGKVYSQGTNTYGQLGDGTINPRQNSISTAVKVSEGNMLQNVQEVSAGNNYAIAVTTDGKVYTWGINGEKQLGFDSNIDEGGIQESNYAILKEDITNVERVAAGYVHTAVYKEDGNVFTFGEGTDGQLGNGGNSSYSDPQLVGKDLVKTNKSEILLEEDETTDIDGWIDYFNLFDEKYADLSYEVLDNSLALVDPTSGGIYAIAAGRTSIIVNEVGTDKIAVVNLRILEKGTKPDSMDILIEPQVATSGNHTVMLKVDGTVWTYGTNNYGELGNNTTLNSDEPLQAIFPSGTIITKIAVGENHNLALDSEGNVWVWGRNNYYQLGNNSSQILTKPTKITSINHIKDIECGNNTSFALTEAGEVYAWGLNANGECGIGSYTNRITINKVPYMTNVIDIKAGKNHSVILRSNGDVYVTGSNLYGELAQNMSVRKVNAFTKVEGIEKVINIAVGDSNISAVKVDGKVYSWGENIYKELGTGITTYYSNLVSQVQGLRDIRYIEGGKGYNLAINANGEIYEIGLNSSGELGNNSNTNITSYSKLTTIDDVMQVSAGIGYTVYLKNDGTVWANGDYTNGDMDIKAKTRSSVPIQVGNDETGLEITELILAKNKSKKISDKCAFELNLIKLDRNFADTLSYVSINEDIATVNEGGIVTGIKVGTTRVNATSAENGRTYSVLVKVVENENQTAPRIISGDNFVAALKADGSVWTWGYNSDGRLAIGNNITKDIPTKTNILATYVDIKAGKDFIIALRDGGKVWAVGNNTSGQLGDLSASNRSKLAEVQGLSDITRIAAGENFGVAIDKLGIVYKWGDGLLEPTVHQISSQRIIDVSAGNDETVYVTAKGTVIGEGSLLDGEIEGITNAIKSQVTNDSIIILTSDLTVYEYSAGTLTQIDLTDVIDISANEDSVMMQTSDEKVYVMGDNINGELGVGTNTLVSTPVQAIAHGTDIYGIGAGYNNTYTIRTNGSVYSAGDNTYGQIGNGTRTDYNEHTLVGKRNFKIEPESKTMRVGDVEDVTVKGEPFNVFGKDEIMPDEYDWLVDDNTIVEVEPGKFTAKTQGTAHITVKDKSTLEEIQLTRIITEPDKDRIKSISVNTIEATLSQNSTEDDMRYEVKVVTNGNTGTLKITTNENTDRISIDNGTTWSYNGSLNQEIDLIDKITTLTITVGVQNNNNEFPVEKTYLLTIEKVTDDIELKKITVTETDSLGAENTITATPVSLSKYEAVVDENTQISLVNVFANCEYTEVSIDGESYNLETASKYITLGNDLSKNITITVKTEAGTEAEYTLVIYKKNAAMELSSLKVNNKEATKVSEGVYAVTVDYNCSLAEVIATVTNNLAQISISNDEYKVQVSTKDIPIDEDTTIVPIKVKLEEDIKEYTLYIYRDSQDGPNNINIKMDMVMVNGSVVEPESDGVTYIAYLPSAETQAVLRAIAKDANVMVKIDGNAQELHDSEKDVLIPNVENTFIITLEDQEHNTQDYTVKIRKAEADTSLKEVYVTKGVSETKAVLQTDGTYLVKVPSSYEDIDVTAITGYTLSKVDVNETGTYVVHQVTENVTLTGEITEVKIKVQSKDESQESEYILKIQKQSTDATLEKVEVDGNEATLGTDGKYHYYLNEALSNVSIKAITNDINANVRVDNSQYGLHEITKQVDITAKQNIFTIKVKAEDGTIRNYELVVEGLPDDATIEKVVVNGTDAIYIEGKNRYEVRLDGTTFNVEVTLTDLLASMKLGTNEKAIGQDNITVTKTDDETIVKVKVTSQNGLETEEYTIAILEKSSNANLDTLVVNGKIITAKADGTYYAGIKHADMEIGITATAEDNYAISQIDGQANSSYIASKRENIVEGTEIYNYVITVTAEDGTSQTYYLTVERLEENTNILGLKVGENEEELYDATLQEDGTYYYKIARVNKGFVNIELESDKSSVIINGVKDSLVEVRLLEDINTIPIKVVAEDGTIRDVILIIEKMSNDTSVNSITGSGVLEVEYKQDYANVYVDEDLTSADLLITLTNTFGKLKLSEESDFEPSSINRTIDLSDYATNGVVLVNLNVIAEDGTEGEYTISIYKKSNLDISSVIVNSNEVEFNETLNRYEKVVANGNRPNIVITADNLLQKVELLSETGTVLATGTGSVTTTQTLSTSDLTTKYVIRITSHNGDSLGTKEYDLWIRQKSTETGITYIKVDGLGTTVDGTTYSSIVSGKDKYPVEIKLKNENAKVRVEDNDGNVLIANQVGTLTGEISVSDGETRSFKVIVTSENGEVKNYVLTVERISSNYEISGITVTDYDVDGATIITKNVTIYDSATKTYKIVVNKDLPYSNVTVDAQSQFTNIVLDNLITATGSANITKTLTGLGINQVVIKLTAADGSVDIRYLELVQLSDDIGIEKVEVDGVEVESDEAGNYETTITDEIDLANIKVTLLSGTSKVSINGLNELSGSTELNVSKGNNRRIVLPIHVIAEDNTEYTYTLTLNIISHDTSVEYVKVDDEQCRIEDNKYKVYIDAYESSANVEIKTGVEYSTIKHIMEDTSEVSGVQSLTYTVDTSDLTSQVFTSTFTVIAEDGTECEYEIELTRKNDDNTVSEVYVNDIYLRPNEDHIVYANGTYGIVQVVGNTARIKVIATNEFTTVEFDGASELKELEKVVTLSTEDKITEVPVRIISQQGTVRETIIYIEKVSNNYNLEYVKANYEEAEAVEEFAYRQYIFDTMTSVEVEIKAEDETAIIVRTTEEGLTYLDENAASFTGRGILNMNVPTPDMTQTIYFKIIAENGEESEVYSLDIEKMSTDATLSEIYVDGKRVELNENGKYVTTIYDVNTSPLIKAVTTHEKANVRIALGNENLHISEENVNVNNSRQITIPITVRSQAGTSKVTYLYLNKISTSLALNTVTLDGREADIYDQDRHTYRFLEDNEKTEFELFVLADSEYTILEYEDVEYDDSLRTIVEVGINEEGKTLKVKATSESGSEQIYTIEIARRSDNTNLEYLKVDDKIRTPDVANGDTYTVRIAKDAVTALIEVQTEYSYANVRLGDNQVVRAHDKGVIDISDLSEDRIIIPVVVTAADGTTIRTYNVILLRSPTTIYGKFTTENAEDKHIADVYVYRTDDTRTIGDEIDPREVVTHVTTDEDGIYVLQLPRGGTYDVVIEKTSYLRHIVTGVEVEDFNIVELEDAQIYAGDIDENGEIELDDLVAFNDRIGEAIKEENKKFDLNEDGIIDNEDRKLIKANYHKENIIVEWERPDTQSNMEMNGLMNQNMGGGVLTTTGTGGMNTATTNALTVNSAGLNAHGIPVNTTLGEDGYIKPIEGEYEITSEYGYRIHPITEEETFHSGIDMSGEHLGNILAVASGEVTYAGVQDGYGNCVEIKHEVNGETVYSFYAHLAQINVNVGDNVSQGDVIGLQGGAETDPNPGTSTGTHLHFEMRSESGSGHSLDPNDYVEL